MNTHLPPSAGFHTNRHEYSQRDLRDFSYRVQQLAPSNPDLKASMTPYNTRDGTSHTVQKAQAKKSFSLSGMTIETERNPNQNSNHQRHLISASNSNMTQRRMPLAIEHLDQNAEAAKTTKNAPSGQFMTFDQRNGN